MSRNFVKRKEGIRSFVFYGINWGELIIDKILLHLTKSLTKMGAESKMRVGKGLLAFTSWFVVFLLARACLSINSNLQMTQHDVLRSIYWEQNFGILVFGQPPRQGKENQKTLKGLLS
jgi:hypothetical protein